MKKNVKVINEVEVIKPSYSTTVKTRAKRFAKTTAYCAGVQLGAGLIVWGTKTLVNKITDKNKKVDEGNVVYDDEGNIIYRKDFNGIEYYYKYDDHGNLIYRKDSNGDEYHYEYKYNDKGDVIYYKDYTGKEYYYDDKGNNGNETVNMFE